MEFLTILLSSLLAIVSPVGVVTDRLIEQAIRDRLDSAETLAVRVDNAPSYQLLQGRVNRVRIAGRGVYPVPDLRIAALEVETDAIAINPARLRQGRPQFDQPLQAGVRMVLSQEDVNQVLQSEAIAGRLQNLSFNLLGGAAAQQFQRYDIIEPQVQFLDTNRLQFQVSLQERQSGQQLELVAESGLEVVAGQQLRLVNPIVQIDGQTVPAPLLAFLIQGVEQQLNLRNLEVSGILLRILQLEVGSDEIEIAAFVRVEPALTASGN